MPEEEIFNEFEDRELRTLTVMLSASAERTAVTIEEYIQIRLEQGTDLAIIRETLLDDLEQGGRIFGQFRNEIKSTTRGSMGRVRDSAEFSEVGVTEQYRWVAVLVRTCKDCLGLHGKVKQWEDWEQSRFGLPRSGGTRCRQNCQCVLVDAKSVDIQPIIRGKK